MLCILLCCYYASVRMRKQGIRGSVCVCVCVCLVCRLLQLLKDQLSAGKSFYRLLVTFSWILIRGFGNALFSNYAWFCLRGMSLQPFQKSA